MLKDPFRNLIQLIGIDLRNCSFHSIKNRNSSPDSDQSGQLDVLIISTADNGPAGVKDARWRVGNVNFDILSTPCSRQQSSTTVAISKLISEHA